MLAKDKGVHIEMESEGYVGGQTCRGITETNLTGGNSVGYGLLEAIVAPSNLNAAYRQVKANKGDKMQVESRDFIGAIRVKYQLQHMKLKIEL